MSKVVLVLDKMPENCIECPLRFKDGDTDDWFRFRCHMSTDQIPKEGKLDNCELKHLPEKYTTEDLERKLASAHDDYYTGWAFGEYYGRNEVLYEILGE